MRVVLRPILLAFVVVTGACNEPARPSVVPAVEAAADTAGARVPPPVDAVRAIYEGYAKSPDGFDRTRFLSRFYVEDNGRIDAECRAGGEHRRCNGDRFSCIAMPPKKAGSVVDVVALGEQPGVSATVRVTLQFGKTTTKADVDAVVEGGVWKIDQVRCE